MKRNRKVTLEPLEIRVCPAPVVLQTPNQYLQETQGLSVQIQAQPQTMGDSLAYGFDGTQPPGITISEAGRVAWLPPRAVATYWLDVLVTETGASPGVALDRFPVSVFDNTPMIQAGINANIVLGKTFGRNGIFTDPDPDSWIGTVDFGDGSGTVPLVLNLDKTFTLSHVYTTPGTYLVSVIITDSQNGRGYAYFSVNVAQVNASSSFAPDQSHSEVPSTPAQSQRQSPTTDTPHPLSPPNVRKPWLVLSHVKHKHHVIFKPR